jgi:Ca2+-binding EF-hand superfamily protein
MKPTLAAAFCLASLWAVPDASAQAIPAAVEERIRVQFAVADENKDGVVEVDEIVGHALYVFARHDVNKNRYLELSELPGHDPARFRQADRDGDGRLSHGEVAADKVLEFFEIDTNHNGVITVQEVIVYETAQRAKRK